MLQKRAPNGFRRPLRPGQTLRLLERGRPSSPRTCVHRRRRSAWREDGHRERRDTPSPRRTLEPRCTGLFPLDQPCPSEATSHDGAVDGQRGSDAPSPPPENRRPQPRRHGWRLPARFRSSPHQFQRASMTIHRRPFLGEGTPGCRITPRDLRCQRTQAEPDSARRGCRHVAQPFHRDR